MRGPSRHQPVHQCHWQITARKAHSDRGKPVREDDMIIWKFSRTKARSEERNSKRQSGTQMITSGVINTSRNRVANGQVAFPSLGMLSVPCNLLWWGGQRLRKIISKMEVYTNFQSEVPCWNTLFLDQRGKETFTSGRAKKIFVLDTLL